MRWGGGRQILFVSSPFVWAVPQYLEYLLRLHIFSSNSATLFQVLGLSQTFTYYLLMAGSASCFARTGVCFPKGTRRSVNWSPCQIWIDSATSPMTGIGKLKSISQCQQWVDNRQSMSVRIEIIFLNLSGQILVREYSSKFKRHHAVRTNYQNHCGQVFWEFCSLLTMI